MCGYPILSYFEESDRQTIDVGMRTLLFRPLVLRGRFCKRGGAGRLRSREKGRVPPPKGKSVRTVRVRVRSGTAFRRHTAAPCRGAISTGFEPLRSGQREFFRTMVRM